MPLPTALPITRRGALAAALATVAWRPALATANADTAQAGALHVLDRFAFGPTPGDLERVTRMGTGAWVAEQLHPVYRNAMLISAGLMVCGAVLAFVMIPNRVTKPTPPKTFCDPCSPPVSAVSSGR